MFVDALVIIALSAVIGLLSYFMAPIAEKIEEVYEWPNSVKGAVIDAISSSFPEFAISLVAVIYYNKADVGLNTIVGSALFNLLLIPGVCAFVMKMKKKQLDATGFLRDSIFYFIATIGLAVSIYYLDGLNLIIAIFFVIFYVLYLWFISRHVVKHRSALESFQEQEGIVAETAKTINKWALWFKILVFTLMIGGVCHVLVEKSLSFGAKAGLSDEFIGFFILAAATSIPDMMMSVVSASRGNLDASISNVFASNIFDICICIFVPLIIYFVLNGINVIDINTTSLKSVYALIGCSFVSFFIYGADKPLLTRARGVFLVIFYFVSLSFIYTL